MKLTIENACHREIIANVLHCKQNACGPLNAKRDSSENRRRMKKKKQMRYVAYGHEFSKRIIILIHFDYFAETHLHISTLFMNWFRSTISNTYHAMALAYQPHESAIEDRDNNFWHASSGATFTWE